MGLRFGGTKIPRSEENTTSSAMRISPESGFSRPAMERRVVLLPQPLGPSSVNNPPSLTSKLMPLTASTAPLSIGKTTRKFFTMTTEISY